MPTVPTIHISLARVEDLFTTPETTAGLHAPQRLTPGVEELVTNLELQHHSDTPHILITLPASEANSTTPEAIHYALVKYAELKKAQNLNTIHITRKQGKRSLIYSIVIAALAAALYAILRSIDSFPEILFEIIAAILLILGWVVLWIPLEQLFIDWLPYHAENNALELLERSVVNVRAGNELAES